MVCSRNLRFGKIILESWRSLLLHSRNTFNCVWEISCQNHFSCLWFAESDLLSHIPSALGTGAVLLPYFSIPLKIKPLSRTDKMDHLVATAAFHQNTLFSWGKWTMLGTKKPFSLLSGTNNPMLIIILIIDQTFILHWQVIPGGNRIQIFDVVDQVSAY